MYSLIFQPRLDGDFFKDDPIKLLQSAPPKRSIIGVTNVETILYGAWVPVSFSIFGISFHANCDSHFLCSL